jgi:hypothetical protein
MPTRPERSPFPRPIVEPETFLSRFAAAEEMPTLAPGQHSRPPSSFRAPIPFPRAIVLPLPAPTGRLCDRDGPLVAAAMLVVVLLATAVVYVARTPARLDPATRDAVVARSQASPRSAPAPSPRPNPPAAAAASLLYLPPPPPTTTAAVSPEPPPPPPPRSLRKAHRAAARTGPS